MSEAFERALSIVLLHEGGYVNHPDDPGGMTNLGVTARTWSEWVGHTATEPEMRRLTRAMVGPLYKARYWDALAGDSLPPALALCLFDFGVNAGPARAARMLQELVGAAQDGQIGPMTLAAIQQRARAGGLPALVRAYQDSRRVYYRSLRTFRTFGKGWLRRVDEVQAAALALAGNG